MKYHVYLSICFFAITTFLKAQSRGKDQLDSTIVYLKTLTSNDSCLTKRFGKYESQETKIQEYLNAGIILMKDDVTIINVNESNIIQLEWLDGNKKHVSKYFVTVTSLFNETIDIIESSTNTAIIDFSPYKKNETLKHLTLKITSSYCRSSDLISISLQ